MAYSKLFVVTGANSELGSQIVGDLSRQFGADKIIATTRTDTGEAFRSLPNVSTLPHVDLATQKGVQELESKVSEDACDQMFMVHCAGAFPSPGLVVVSDVDCLRKTIDDNFVSFAGALRSVLPGMRRKHFGRILAFSSHTSRSNAPYFAAFDASKRALESLVRSAANESAKYGIAVNALAIATLSIQTERKMKPSGDHESWLKLEDVSRASIDLLLLSDLINGNVIHCWRHSDSFFGMSVMERNSLNVEY